MPSDPNPPDPWILADAIMAMASRLATSDRRGVYAFNRYLHANTIGQGDRAAAAQTEQKRYERAVQRQRVALRRLVDALRDLAAGAP